MNGAHDLGGMHGMGPVEPEPDEPVFHAEWEQRVFALIMAMGAHGRWNLDSFRSAVEHMPAAEYLATGYYEHWLFALEKLLIDHGFLTREEIASPQGGRREARADGGPVRTLRAADVERAVRNRQGARMDVDAPRRFRPGDRVVARNVHPTGHIRLPRYARGRQGVVDRDQGVFILPDAHAAGLGKQPERLYGVRFTARELWGADAWERDAVYVDLFDSYLDPA